MKPVQKTAPTKRLRPGDLICGDCGEGNTPTRKFCSRCGSSLGEAEIVKTPWWRKLLPRRKPKTLEAGERPGRGGVKARKKRRVNMRLVRRVVSLTLLIGSLLFTFVAPFRTFLTETAIQPAKDAWRDFTTQEFDPVRPASFSATVQHPEDPVDRVFDLAANTFMLAPGDQPLVVIVTFPEPVDLDRLIVHNGARDSFTNFSRPKDLHLVFDTGKTFDVTLKDQPDKQKLTIKNGEQVTRLEIHVTSVYAAVSNATVALTEVEMFTER